MKNVIIFVSLAAAAMGCNNGTNTNDQIQAARKAAIDSVNRVVEIERMKQATIDSMNLVQEQQLALAEAKKANTATKTKETVIYRDGGSSSSGGYTPVSYTSNTPAKKKMNPALKGALIGTGVGALAGVAIAKDKKGQGALIGAAAGAAAGALGGVIIDKQKQKKQAQQQPRIYY